MPNTLERHKFHETRLDSMWPRIVEAGDNVYLKRDVQKYKLEVLRGAEPVLPAVHLIELEFSFVPLHRGAPLFADIFDWLRDHSFAPVAFEALFDDPSSGRALQVDGIFGNTGRPS